MVSGLGARDRDWNIAEFGFDVRRPRIAGSAGRSAETPPRGPAPVLLHQIAEGGGGIPTDDHLNVMSRRGGTVAGIDAPRVIRRMRRRVPPSIRNVEAPGKADRGIDYDIFLVMRRAQGMAVIEQKMQPPVGAPGMAVKRDDFPVGCVDQREIPDEEVNVELWIAAQKEMQKIPEARRLL